MSARVIILGLVALAVAPELSSMPQQAPKKAPASKRTELFVGNGSSTWLPKTAILPSATDIETRAQKLSSRVRNMDPFGLSTFPREEELLAAKTEVVRSAERVTLNQALQSLKVTGINLEKKEILMRGRNVFEGDVMVLSYKDEIFLAQVTEVGATQIHFRDVKRQETGVLPHSLLPHLELEPIQKRGGRGSLEGKVSPMETIQPQQP